MIGGLDECDLRVDGNAVAGLLGEVFALEMTAALAGCASCGTANPVSALVAYGRGMGAVLRCPACESAVVRVAHDGGCSCLELRGAVFLQLDEAAWLGV